MPLFPFGLVINGPTFHLAEFFLPLVYKLRSLWPEASNLFLIGEHLRASGGSLTFFPSVGSRPDCAVMASYCQSPGPQRGLSAQHLRQPLPHRPHLPLLAQGHQGAAEGVAGQFPGRLWVQVRGVHRCQLLSFTLEGEHSNCFGLERLPGLRRRLKFSSVSIFSVFSLPRF